MTEEHQAKKPIPIQVARDQLKRINDALNSRHLLIGGLAVRHFVVQRDSHDIDLVCEHAVSMQLLQELYPAHDWQVVEKTDDSYRPTYRVTHRSEEYGEIVFGPKIAERGAYEFLDWEFLLEDGIAVTLGGESLENIVVPNCAHLAYTKLISFLERSSTSPEKRRQDLQDLVDLSNQEEFRPITFFAMMKKSRAEAFATREFQHKATPEDWSVFENSSFITSSGWCKRPRAVEPATELDDAKLLTDEQVHQMRLISEEVVKIARKHGDREPACFSQRDLLLVVDVQRDFFADGALVAEKSSSLIKPLNKFIHERHRNGAYCVFTRDWHPEDHHSFKQWPVHCVQDTPGAALHSDLVVPEGSLVVDIGTSNESDGYSPFDDIRLPNFIRAHSIHAIYVVGIALEFCILATCRDALWFASPVVAIEPLIVAANDEENSKEQVWSLLESMGIVRSSNIPQLTS